MGCALAPARRARALGTGAGRPALGGRAVLVALALVAAGCGTPHRGASPAWGTVDLGGWAPAGTTARVVAVAATPTGWLAGGVEEGTGGAPPSVSIWSAPRVTGPWFAADMAPIRGRDGPQESILGFATHAGRLVALGSRPSPTEGYPRPSTWSAPGPAGPWREVLEDREFFGGPSIVGLGGLTAGPHGFTVTGTWTDAAGRPTAAVWRSPDGQRWSRDSTAPAFDSRGPDSPLAAAVADSPGGLVVVGSWYDPVPGDPTRTTGALWYSPDGGAWRSLAIGPAGAASAFDAVVAVPGGWLVGGRVGYGRSAAAAVWTLDRRLHLGPAEVLDAGHPTAPVALAAGGGVVVAVVASGPRITLLEQCGASWQPVVGPPASAPAPTYLAAAVRGSTALIAAAGGQRSEVLDVRLGPG